MNNDITELLKFVGRHYYDVDKDNFIKKLSKIILYRIEVPEHMDLNIYLEIMNTRGEQLEHPQLFVIRY